MTIMPKNLEELIAAAKTVAQTPEQREQQRRSFAYGNTHFENGRITREMVDQQANALKQTAKNSR